MGLVKPRTVGIIGCGHVGSHVASAVALRGVAEVICLADIDVAKCNAQALDLQDSVAYLPHHVQIVTRAVEDLGDCDAIVIAAGPLPDNDEDRLQTLPRTLEVMGDVIQKLRSKAMASFEGLLLCISNPADVVATYLQMALRLPPQRVICTGTALDSARLQAILSRELQHVVSPVALRSAYMLGEHGNSCIVAWSHVSIGGKPLDQLQKEDPAKYPDVDREAVQRAVHRRGYHVLQGKGSTEFGIGNAAAEILSAVFHDEHKVIPCSVNLQGKYGESDVFASVPVVVGANGVEDIIELQLPDSELKGFKHSCEVIRTYVQQALKESPLLA